MSLELFSLSYVTRVGIIMTSLIKSGGGVKTTSLNYATRVGS